jgi:toxin-antitoxin system PIN domain toxin
MNEPYLLDVNVLIALAWPEHIHYTRARAWFAKNGKKGWATCPMVEAGFVRIVSNPAFSLRSVSVEQAVDALQSSLQAEAHRFWPDSISFPEAVRILKMPAIGRQQITDAYLVALAIRNRGKLATLDRGIMRIAPAGVVELVA